LSALQESRRWNLSTVFAGQNVGINEVEKKIWLITFMNYALNKPD